ALLAGSRACLYSVCAALIFLGLMIAATRLPFREALAQPRWAWVCVLLVACTLLVPWFLSVTPSDSGWLHTSGRDVTWGKAVTLLKDRPYLGVGYESFGLAAREISPDVQEPPITAHNFFLQILTCTGPLGLLALLLLFHRPALMLLRRAASPASPLGPDLLLAGFAFVFIMVVLAGQAQHWFYSHSNAILFWLALAVLAAAPIQPHPSPPATPAEPPPLSA
ncbi:MAG: O-antigen ligase family protein, partial [Phycisphaerales bacterium]